MRALLLLGGAGAAFYAYQRGLLDDLAGLLPGSGSAAPREVAGPPRAPGSAAPREVQGPPRAPTTADIREATGGQVMPILGDDEVIEVNRYEAILRENWAVVSGWAKANVGWAAAILATENAGLQPGISGDNGTSHGLFQVKEATAETCVRAGYIGYDPDRETLLTVAGSIYFGTAEMERLSKIPGKGDNRDWVITAYNGGAGWELMPAKYQRDRKAYLAKVKRKFLQLYGPKEVG